MHHNKTADLDPTKNYLAGYHPHGVFAFGAWGTFGCDALGWDKFFPGIKRQYITLEVMNDRYLHLGNVVKFIQHSFYGLKLFYLIICFKGPFWMPGFREVAHGSGGCKSSKGSIEYLLR